MKKNIIGKPNTAWERFNELEGRTEEIFQNLVQRDKKKKKKE